MSIEYTIDIQLTELGFPDILQTQETSSTDPLSPRRSCTSFSKTPKEKRLLRLQQSAAEDPQVDATKHATDAQQTSVSSASPVSLYKPPHAVQSLEDADKGVDVVSVLPVVSQPSSPSTALETTETPQLTAEQEENVPENVDDGHTAKDDSMENQPDVDDESDDSEVSDFYEEEEEEVDDEEDQEEENGLENESGDYHCTVCDLHLSSSLKLQEHMNLHTGARPYCCAECGKRFCQMYNYRAHLRTHARTKGDRRMCRVCLMRFVSEEDLKAHQASTHFEDEFYECDLCKLVFTSLKACEYHVQFHKNMPGVICELCGRNFSNPKSLARHRSKTCNHTFKCTDCPKIFSKKNALLKHSFSHLGLLPYTCIRCHCHFRLAKLYRQHKCEPQRIHCVACLRAFVNQEDFQQHKKDTGCWGHQGVKKDEIRCLECGQRFDTSEELKKHAGAHQRVLKCAECGKGFRSALLLMSHMGGHAGQSPCLCQSCGLGFPHQQSYDSHLKTCGQTPLAVNAQKKRQASKTSPAPPTVQFSAIPSVSNTVTLAATVPAVALNKPATQVEVSSSLEGVSVGSRPAEGMWKLTLEKQPPPGVNLVLFIPAGSALANGLTFPSPVPEAVRRRDVQVQPQVALPAVSSGKLRLNETSLHLDMNAALGAPLKLNSPLELAAGSKRNPECAAPLDLSKRYTAAPNSVQPLPIKIEPEESEISRDARGIKRDLPSGDKSTDETDTQTKVKHLKTDPMLLSPLTVNIASSELVKGIKKEPHTPDSVCHLQPSTSCPLTHLKSDKEIKMEVGRAQADPEGR
ncbi:hypothetical protein LDENG_00199380 [Lucifuga dentata]|nr:hypothetical protein LDENG_00199380 [Lucifuga dentata]